MKFLEALKDITTSLLEEGQNELMAQAKLKKAGKIDDYDALLSITAPYNNKNKHLFKLVDYWVAANGTLDINALRETYTNFMNTPAFARGDINRYPTYESMVDAVNSVESKISKQDLENIMDDAIYEDDNIKIYWGENKEKCIKYGQGPKFGFCISANSLGNMFWNYRKTGATFYFIYFKNKEAQARAPKELIVIHAYPDNKYKINYAKPNSDHSITPKAIVSQFPALNGLIGSVIKYVPFNEHEQKIFEVGQAKRITDLKTMDMQLLYIELNGRIRNEDYDALNEKHIRKIIEVGGREIPQRILEKYPYLTDRYVTRMAQQIEMHNIESLEYFKQNNSVWWRSLPSYIQNYANSNGYIYVYSMNIWIKGIDSLTPEMAQSLFNASQFPDDNTVMHHRHSEWWAVPFPKEMLAKYPELVQQYYKNIPKNFLKLNQSLKNTYDNFERVYAYSVTKRLHDMNPDLLAYIQQNGYKTDEKLPFFIKNEDDAYRYVRDRNINFANSIKERLDSRGVFVGDINLSSNNIYELPDLSFITSLKGDFRCAYNKLSSLKGLPQEIEGSFDASFNKLKTLGVLVNLYSPWTSKTVCNLRNNQLKSLVGLPQWYRGTIDVSHNRIEEIDFLPTGVKSLNISYNRLTTLKDVASKWTYMKNLYVHHNKLISLKGCPKRLQGNFDVYANKLTTLKYGPEFVGARYNCSRNQLISLEGSPKSVGGSFNCSHNQITSPKGMPVFVKGAVNGRENPFVLTRKMITDRLKRIMGESTKTFKGYFKAIRPFNLVFMDK